MPSALFNCNIVKKERLLHILFDLFKITAHTWHMVIDRVEIDDRYGARMINHHSYVPVLKWKMGEYQALSRLSDQIKDRVVPLIEIPDVGYDFEAKRQKESADDHLADFAKRLKSKWQARSCLIDFKFIPAATRLAGNTHCVDSVFGQTREEGCSAIPVVCLSSDVPFVEAVARVIVQDQRGACLRLSLTDFDVAGLPGRVEAILRAMGIGWPDADLVVDFGSPNYLPIAAFVRVLTALYGLIPMQNRWRSITLAGTSYPQSIAALEKPFQLIPRNEWLAYRAFVATLTPDQRIPTFGDYSVAHPDPVELDMRLIQPFAKLRYTITDYWHVARGRTVRTHGFGQYREMCQALIEQPYFSGRNYSSADEYIEDCAMGKVPTGNLSTWVWVSTNRHITKLVRDISNLHGL